MRTSEQQVAHVWCSQTLEYWGCVVVPLSLSLINDSYHVRLFTTYWEIQLATFDLLELKIQWRCQNYNMCVHIQLIFILFHSVSKWFCKWILNHHTLKLTLKMNYKRIYIAIFTQSHITWQMKLSVSPLWLDGRWHLYLNTHFIVCLLYYTFCLVIVCITHVFMITDKCRRLMIYVCGISCQ